jgi:hypothetical protein
MISIPAAPQSLPCIVQEEIKISITKITDVGRRKRAKYSSDPPNYVNYLGNIDLKTPSPGEFCAKISFTLDSPGFTLNPYKFQGRKDRFAIINQTSPRNSFSVTYNRPPCTQPCDLWDPFLVHVTGSNQVDYPLEDPHVHDTGPPRGSWPTWTVVTSGILLILTAILSGLFVRDLREERKRWR